MTWEKGCQVCQRFGKPAIHPDLRPIQADYPFQFVDIDVLGPLPADDEGHKYILSMVDMHIRYLEMCLMKSADIAQITALIPKMWLQQWGSPLMFLTDAGSTFRSRLWQQFCQQHQIRHIHAPAYMQRANGISKRLTQAIQQIIRRCLIARGGQWSQWVDQAVMIYRNLPHDVMKFSPNQLFFGTSLRLFGLPPPSCSVSVPSIDAFPSSVNEARGVLVSHIDRHDAGTYATVCRQKAAQRRYHTQVQPSFLCCWGLSFYIGQLVS